MKTSQEMSANWANNPEPNKNELSPDTILDAESRTDTAYLWKSMNSSRAWLSFDGELMDVKQ